MLYAMAIARLPEVPVGVVTNKDKLSEPNAPFLMAVPSEDLRDSKHVVVTATEIKRTYDH